MTEQPPPSLIKGWLGPTARLLERHEAVVAAPSERAWDAIQRVRLADMPVSRLLFRLRGIPYRREMMLAEFFSTPPFLILQEAPPHEVVIGTAHRQRRPRFPASPEAFRSFTEEGTRRVTANVRAEPTGGGARMSTETWVETFGARARWLFRVYWFFVGPFSALTRREFLRAVRQRLAQDAC